MSNATYNGWTNYATWRINLEIIADLDRESSFSGITNCYDLGDALKSYVAELLENETVDGLTSSTTSLVLDYAFAFLADVDWNQTAQRMLDAYPPTIDELPDANRAWYDTSAELA
jgi:hypothetical protein